MPEIKGLIVVESEEKAQTISDYLSGNEQIIVFRSPPLRVAQASKASGEKNGGFSFEFSPMPAEQENLEKLQKARNGKCYLAFDNEPRGEYLSWMITEYLEALDEGYAPKRIKFNGLNQEGIEQGFQNAEQVSHEEGEDFLVRNFYNSAFVKHIKRLIGTDEGPGGLPLNFFSLTALSLLSEREQEIKLYGPGLKWQIQAKLQGGGGEFMASLTGAHGISEDGQIESVIQGKEVVNMFKDEIFRVSRISRQEVSLPAPQPYILSEVLQDAYLFHEIGPQNVWTCLKKLYTGIKTGAKRCGLISSFKPTYEPLPRQWQERMEEEAARLFSQEMPEQKKALPISEESIIPLLPEISEDEVAEALGDECAKVYGLIRNRALAGHLNNATCQSIEVELQAGKHCVFRAAAKCLTDKGYLSVYQNPGDRELLVSPCPLESLNEGDTVSLLKVLPRQAQSFQSEYYTFDTLLADLSDFSIDTEESVAQLLGQMLEKGYLVISQEGFLRPEDRTIKVLDIVGKVFPTMQGINLSAYTVQTIDEALSGRKALDFALRQFEQTLHMQGKPLLAKKAVSEKREPLSFELSAKPRATGKIIKAPSYTEEKPMKAEKAEPLPSEADGSAPEGQEGRNEEVEEAVQEGNEPVTREADAAEADCAEEPGLDMAGEAEQPVAQDVAGESAPAPMENVEGNAAPLEPAMRSGDSALAAESKPQAEVAEVSGRNCPVCGESLFLKEDRFGRYKACSGYPACRHTESYREAETPLMACPLCHQGGIFSKRTPTGKDFYVCPKEDCDFMSWSKPHPEPCPVCHSPYLVEKRSGRGANVLRCPRAGCGFMKSVAAGTTGSVEDGKSSRKRMVVRRKRAGSSGGKKRRVVVRRK